MSECLNMRSRWSRRIQHRTWARLVQRNIASGRSEARDLGDSNQKRTVLLVIDVARAYFQARARRRVYVEPPEGDGGGPGSWQCGLLRKSLYGTRDAAQHWECKLGGFLDEIGLRKGTSEHVPFLRRGARVISFSVHGDDVTIKASREEAEWLIRKFQERYEIKTEMIGEAADLDTQLQIL